MVGLSLLRNRGLAAKDILLDLAGGCFRQLGHKLDSLGTLEVRQMITSVIAQQESAQISSEARNLIETHQHVGDFQRAVRQIKESDVN